jgi:pyruvate/2-oxoglutarate dehydrogenase complex dihydrolipoamide acyltransferase (E2) component
MLDEETIERIVEKVLRRLLVELAPPDGGPPRLTSQEAARARAALASAAVAPRPPAPRPPAPAPVAHRHPGRLLSEEDLVSYYRRGIRALALEPRCLVTPAARDRARDLQVDLVAGG